MNVLIAIFLIFPSFSNSLTCRIDLEKTRNIIEKLKEIIQKEKKNQKALEQKLIEMGKSLYLRDEHISHIEIELHDQQ